ncbi:Bifunctional protein GlmU [Candidatus Rhabdochlamydia oedothoracis]|uniref:Bifunctional protein GlmU n=1 Tax=Candidatus Rhabdochlamydia oedothoracis TaxID=2720720 RepID=A0ABX8UYK8_9BACT|nr:MULTISPECIES: UDP-N-acetylglucosamine diphosphorylase [Rhabdochlamydia]KAG6559906.1 Bifunctional protein GlmU [Candidatus Rhabdochlamydia sp. W815]MCL6755799.1 UDP-N-acetylglucosamine diphosphorylase [Candidatus Rhabdochlamydia oedothoracis]QYF48047.1 Bifunctional protein GlmU [Candidatus Rhabdochlamydia oedothoracis]
MESLSLFCLDAYEHRSLFDGLEYPWEALERLSTYLLEQKLGKIEIHISSGVLLTDPDKISIGSGTIVEPGAYIQGPCVIGRDCQIRQGAYIRGNVLITDQCVIGHGSEIKHSVFFNKAAAPHFNYVGDSILGNGVNLGAGVKCANYRLDHQCISVYWGQQKIKTRLKKLGACIGDNSQIGCNTVINPGTCIGKDVICHPNMTLQRYVPQRSLVKFSSHVIVESL